MKQLPFSLLQDSMLSKTSYEITFVAQNMQCKYQRKVKDEKSRKSKRSLLQKDYERSI
jgi:hypothetical protein